MTDQPVLKLFTELGREPTDTIVVSHYSPTREWSSTQIKLIYADALVKVLTDEGQNVYTSVNPVGHIEKGRGDAASVSRLVALWADLDYKDSGLADETAARAVIDSLSAVIHSNPVAVVHSGHGLQPYWAVEDGHVSELNRNWMAGLLKRWGYLVQRFAEIEHGKVDSVYDLPRVLRAPGSTNFKVEGHPVVAELEIIEWSHALTVQEVDEVLIDYGFLNEHLTVDAFDVVAPPENWQPAERDCAWSVNLATEIGAGDPKERHPWLMGKATKIEVAARNGCITESTYAGLVQLLDARFELLLSQGAQPRKASPGEVGTAFKWARMRVSTFSDLKMADNLNYHSHRKPLYAVPDLPLDLSPSETSTVTNFPTSGSLALQPELAPITLGEQNFLFTDATNAERLASAAMGQYIFVPGLGWHQWKNGHYERDVANSIVRLAITTSKEFAAGSPDKATLEWAQRSMAAPAIASAVRLAESVPEMVVLPTQLDSKPYDLCTPNGIVDLEHGVLRDATPATDMHTRQTRFTPQPGPHPLWDAFLATTFEQDKEMIDYVQALLGVALIGELRWQILPVFAGRGANGKSALLEVAAECLGDYAAVMPENFLLDSGKLEHSTEIFRLRGVRLAIASETRPDGKFNESRVKMLTGETVLSARAMRQDFVDFKATHTIFVALNHPPAVSAGGDGFWRRLRLIMFNHQVPTADREEGLSARIAGAEGPQILAWMIEGATRVIRDRLIEPKSVVDDTDLYRSEEDHVHAWLDEMTLPNPTSVHSSKEIYGNYVAWCKRSGEQPLANVALFRDLRNRVTLIPERVGRQRGWRGLLVFVERED